MSYERGIPASRIPQAPIEGARGEVSSKREPRLADTAPPPGERASAPSRATPNVGAPLQGSSAGVSPPSSVHSSETARDQAPRLEARDFPAKGDSIRAPSMRPQASWARTSPPRDDVGATYPGAAHRRSTACGRSLFPSSCRLLQPVPLPAGCEAHGTPHGAVAPGCGGGGFMGHHPPSATAPLTPHTEARLRSNWC